MIEVQELLCGYAPKKPVVGPLSFSIARGEIVCMLGPNGVGKTTLFKTLLGLLKPLGGGVQLCGRALERYRPKELARVLAYVPQEHIPPFPYRVCDVVVMGCNPNMHELSSPGEREYEKAMDMLSQMGVAHLAQQDYTAISGGERQMVLIARALAQDTKILVLDEPTAHLDYGNESRVLAQVQRLSGIGYTILMISHMPNHAFLCCDRVLAIGRDGFFASGEPDTVLSEETLSRLYGIDIQVSSVALDGEQRQVRLCVPRSIDLHT